MINDFLVENIFTKKYLFNLFAKINDINLDQVESIRQYSIDLSEVILVI